MFGLFSFKNPRFRFIIIAVSLTFVACTALIGYVALPAQIKPFGIKNDVIKAPTLIGYGVIKASEIARASGLRIEVDRWVSSKDYPINHVVGQKPLPNQKIRKGDKVIIELSGGNTHRDSGEARGQSTVTSEDQRPLQSLPDQSSKSLSGRVVVIDPGHQRRANLKREPIGPGATETKEKIQGGTTGIKSKRPEYQVTLEISKRLKSVLESHGIKVVMVRETHDVNISNAERAEVANIVNADLFIRIHADGALDPQKNGISTLYPALNKWTAPIYKESLRAARIVQKSVIETIGRKDNGIIGRNDISGFNWSKVPVILVEMGFLTNPEEDLLLNDTKHQDLLASGIGDGIVEHLRTIEESR
ncbi:MAG: N-acetylmuramoyl-L-alanine amidase [Actinobacteria bacterium]|nr:N-acetylmuramoyl-L-alanine amidase [Actinomycetota bacterium]